MTKQSRFAIGFATFAMIAVGAFQFSPAQSLPHPADDSVGYAMAISSGPAARLVKVVNLDDWATTVHRY